MAKRREGTPKRPQDASGRREEAEATEVGGDALRAGQDDEPVYFDGNDQSSNDLGAGIANEIGTDEWKSLDKKTRTRLARATREELAERTDFCVFLLQRRAYKSDIKRLMRHRFVNMPWQTIEWYIRRARTKLKEQYESTKRNAREDSINLWVSLVRGPDVDARTKAMAQQILDQRLGVDGPITDDERKAIDAAAAVGGPQTHVTEILVTSRRDAADILRLTRGGRRIDNLQDLGADERTGSGQSTDRESGQGPGDAYKDRTENGQGQESGRPDLADDESQCGQTEQPLQPVELVVSHEDVRDGLARLFEPDPEASGVVPIPPEDMVNRNEIWPD